jgi:anaerobic magnesium-protoporphyrin IX monomethyl ester cyclase
MKILLLLPRLEPNTNPPLGLAYVAASLRGHGFDVEILDPTFEDKAYVLKRLSVPDYDVLGISAYTMNFNLGLEFALFAKSKNPDGRVVFGGIHPTILSEEVIRKEGIDFVVAGEGEQTMVELAEALENQSSLESVSGLIFKKNGQRVVNPPRALIQNLDGLPFPARDLLPMKSYLTAHFGRSAWAVRQPSTTIVTTRGCPFRCTYCSSHLMFGRRTRYRSVANILDEIEMLIRDYGVRGLSIVDDTFIISRKHIYELADEMKKRKIKIEFICNGRVDIIDKDVLKALKEVGCVGIAFGVESGSQYVLDHILKKGITLEQVRKAFQWAHEVGIPTDAYFMIGIPGETEKDIQETIRFSKTLRASAANFAITIPMPKTELFDLALEKGEISAKSWNDFDYTGDPVFESTLLDKERVKELEKKAVRSFYFSTRFLFDQLLSLRGIPDLKRKMKGFLMLLKVMFKR